MERERPTGAPLVEAVRPPNSKASCCSFWRCISAKIGGVKRRGVVSIPTAEAADAADIDACATGGGGLGGPAEPGTPAAGAVSPEVAVGPPRFLELPDTVNALGAACCDPASLACLGLASSHLNGLILAPSSGFAARRAAELAARGLLWAKGCPSLEHLAVGLAVASVCGSVTKNHLYFPYGGGTKVRPLTRSLLDGAAALARRHPRLCLHVDAHTGSRAPLGIATRCSGRRAHAVTLELAALGVETDRVSSRSWGRKVSSVWPDAEDHTAARAEIYFRLGGLEVPQRPAYYSLATVSRGGAGGGHAGLVEDESSDEDLQGLARHGRAVALLDVLASVGMYGNADGGTPEAGEDTSEVDDTSVSEDASENEHLIQSP